jgi:transmembrane sensor
MSRYTTGPRPRREVIAEASEWFIEFRSGADLPVNRERFDQWLRQSPEHIQAYLEVAAAWSDLPTQDPEGHINIDLLVARAHSSRGDEVLIHFSTPGNKGPGFAPRVTQRTRTLPRALAACALLVTLIAGAIGWLYSGVTYATGIGEQRTIQLSDSSFVALNARSTIKVHYTRDVRTVELIEGQALFHVTRDVDRPFVVRSDGMAVRAIGTEFDVYRKHSGTVVTVLEGSVSVSGGADSSAPEKRPSATMLSAGEQLTVTPVVRIKNPGLADVAAATAWTQRRLVFEETPLADVAEEFNRYSRRQLIIDDPELARRPISGIYSSSDTTALIAFLRTQPELQVTETEQEFRVTRR